MLLEAWRLLLVIIVIVRFYLGSTYYFARYHQQAKSPYYAIDLFSGIVHFVLFYAWSITVTLSPPPTYSFSLFELLLFAVLLYDLAWLLFCRQQRREQVRYWATINGATFVSILAIHLILQHVINTDLRTAEGLALIPLLFVSLIDIKGMAEDREIIAEWLRRLTAHFKTT